MESAVIDKHNKWRKGVYGKRQAQNIRKSNDSSYSYKEDSYSGMRMRKLVTGICVLFTFIGRIVTILVSYTENHCAKA